MPTVSNNHQEFGCVLRCLSSVPAILAISRPHLNVRFLMWYVLRSSTNTVYIFSHRGVSLDWKFQILSTVSKWLGLEDTSLGKSVRTKGRRKSSPDCGRHCSTHSASKESHTAMELEEQVFQKTVSLSSQQEPTSHAIRLPSKCQGRWMSEDVSVLLFASQNRLETHR